MPKIIYIISDINKALAFEWIADGFKNNKEIEIEFILLNPQDSALETFLITNSIPVKRFTLRGKKDYITVFFKLFYHLLITKPKAIHCHLRDAELLGICAGFCAGIKNRIYTRHSSTYNHLYHPNGVIIDKFINKLSTKIIAISGNVERVLQDKESVPSSKIIKIPHGFDFSLWEKVSNDQLEQIKSRHQIPNKIIIGVIARYTLWKGYEYLIPALEQIQNTIPNTHIVIANARGNNKEEIRTLLKTHLKDVNYTEIEFEADLAALYKVFNIYVHVPYDESVEAFGQTYVEALIAETPSVFTLSGIAPDFIKDQYNALVVPFKDADAIAKACIRLLQDNSLAISLSLNGRKSISQFRLDNYLNSLEALYKSL